MTRRAAFAASRSPPLAFGPARFRALWERSVASPPSPDGASVYATLAAALGAPNRHYHTLDHIRDCVEWVDRIASLLAQPDAVELGLWFHDTILDPGAADNERRSAELFVACSVGASPSFRHRVARLILATAHLAATAYDDRAYIVDIDLAGLAAPWDDFMQKGDLLRREFADQDDAAYYGAQVRFLRRLLDRRWIYATRHFRAGHEADARANLERLLALRAAQGYVAG
jgi:predicted metal-dependent HD superfamily phosphohydrolase